MIRNHITQKIEPKQCHLRQHAPFVGNPGGENVVERRNTIRRDNQEAIFVLINVANFSASAQRVAGQIGFKQRFKGQSQLY